MTTPHINAHKNSFASTVIMPGDPLRAKYIADKFLQDAEQICDVRGMLGFTGYYNGIKLSVMGHGMGIPSASIYTHELYSYYEVQNIIRVGSCGAISDDVNLMDIVIAMGGSTDSKVNRIRFGDHDFAAIPDFNLLVTAVYKAKENEIPVRVGNVFSADLFYTPEPEFFDTMDKMGILGVDMEVAGIYGVAAELNKKALAILTVSDHIKRDEHLSSDDRQTSFDDMVKVALETAISL